MNGLGNNDEAILRQRLAKAETEALKATNERLAAEKRGQAAKEELMSKVTDLQEEVTLRDSHVQALEKEKHDLLSALQPLGVQGRESGEQLRSQLKDVAQQQADAREAQMVLSELTASSIASSSKVTLREAALAARTQLQSLTHLTQEQSKSVEATQHQRDNLQEELARKMQVESSLQRRERELATAKRRLKKLSTTLRKSVPAWVNAATAPDATRADVTTVAGGQVDDTVGGESLSISRDYDSDMLDEMEQLVTFVEDLDTRLEFQKVEVDMERKALVERLNALVADNDGLQAYKTLAEAQLASRQDAIDSLQSELVVTRSRMEVEILAQQEAMEAADGKLVAQEAQIADFQVQIRVHISEKETLKTENNELRNQHGAALDEAQAQASRKLDELVRQHLAAQEDLESRLLRQGEETDAVAKAEAEAIQLLEAERGQYEDEKAQMTEEIGKLNADKSELQSSLAHECQESARLREELQQVSNLGEARTQEMQIALRASNDKERLLSDELSRLSTEAEEKLGAYESLTSQLYSALVSERVDNREMLAYSSTQFQAALNIHDREVCERKRAVDEASRIHQERMAAVEAEVETLRGTVKKLTAEATSLRIVIDQERTNRKLAEDALNQYVASRESDVTVALDKHDCVTRSNSEVSIQALASDQCGAERVAAAADNIAPNSNQTSIHLSARCKELAARRSELEEHVHQYETRIQALDEQVSASLAEIAQLQKKSTVAARETEEEAQRHARRVAKLQEDLWREKQLAEQLKKDNTALAQERDCATTHGAKDASSQSDHSNGIQALQTSQIENLTSEMQQLQSLLAEAQTQRADAEMAMQKANTQLKKLSDERAELQHDLKSVTYALAKAQRDAKKNKDEADAVAARVLDLEASMQQAIAQQEDRMSISAAEMDDLRARLSSAEESVVELTSQRDALQAALDEAGDSHEPFPRSNDLPDVLNDTSDELARAVQMIHDLEHELALKAQECEDADDKELALRKDNKRLMSKLVALQSKVNKAQPGVAKQAHTRTENGDASQQQASSSPAGPPQPSARKRASPDEDQHGQARDASDSVLTRAVIYAPAPPGPLVPIANDDKPAQENADVPDRKQSRRSITFDSPAATRPRTHSSHNARTPSSQRKRRPRVSPGNAARPSTSPERAVRELAKMSSHTPSDVVAQRMHENAAERVITLPAVNSLPNRFRDKTNRSRPQSQYQDELVKRMSALATADKERPVQGTIDPHNRNNPFMAKLHRYKPQ